MSLRTKSITQGILITLLIIALVMIVSSITTLLWNWLMPAIFGLPMITIFQAMGLELLSTILFRSISIKINK